MTCINPSSTWVIWRTHEYPIVMDMGSQWAVYVSTHEDTILWLIFRRWTRTSA